MSREVGELLHERDAKPFSSTAVSPARPSTLLLRRSSIVLGCGNLASKMTVDDDKLLLITSSWFSSHQILVTELSNVSTTRVGRRHIQQAYICHGTPLLPVAENYLQCTVSTVLAILTVLTEHRRLQRYRQAPSFRPLPSDEVVQAPSQPRDPSSFRLAWIFVLAVATRSSQPTTCLLPPFQGLSAFLRLSQFFLTSTSPIASPLDFIFHFTALTCSFAHICHL